MNVVVAMAWRPQPARIAGHDYVVDWWSYWLPFAKLIEVDTDHVPYNLAAVRNEGVRQAEAAGADIVVLTDADAVIVPPENVMMCAKLAVADGRVHMPFTKQRYLTEDETTSVIMGGTAPLDGGHGNGAIYVMRPDTYWQFGGSDERFSGWGGDDDGLVAAARTLVGLERHSGTVWSLWHADERRPVGTEEHRPNAELAQRYWDAVDNEKKMRAIIEERS